MSKKIIGTLNIFKKNDLVRYFYDKHSAPKLYQILKVIDEDEFLIKDLSTQKEHLCDAGEIRLFKPKRQKKLYSNFDQNCNEISSLLQDLSKKISTLNDIYAELGYNPASESFRSLCKESAELLEEYADSIDYR